MRNLKPVRLSVIWSYWTIHSKACSVEVCAKTPPQPNADPLIGDFKMADLFAISKLAGYIWPFCQHRHKHFKASQLTRFVEVSNSNLGCLSYRILNAFCLFSAPFWCASTEHRVSDLRRELIRKVIWVMKIVVCLNNNCKRLGSAINKVKSALSSTDA